MTQLYILAVLCLVVAASEWLVRRTRLRPVGSALLVVVLSAVLANLGVLPAGSTSADPVPVYEAILDEGALLAVFWLLLSVRLRDTLPAIGPSVVLFLAGVVGTAAGVVFALWALDGVATVGLSYDALGGVLVAAFAGGSASVDAVAVGQGLARDSTFYDGVRSLYPVVVAFWLVVTLVVPRLLLPLWPRKALAPTASAPAGAAVTDAEALHAVHLGLVLALGLGAVWCAEAVAAWSAAWGLALPAVLPVAVLALGLAQLRAVARLQGTQMLGTFAAYLLLAVLGARFEVATLSGLDNLGTTLLLVVLIAVAVHGVVVFAAARWIRTDPVLAAVASQAGVGNAASALALARGLGRSDLLLPAVLAGVLGALAGATLGTWAAAYLLPLLGG